MSRIEDLLKKFEREDRIDRLIQKLEWYHDPTPQSPDRITNYRTQRHEYGQRAKDLMATQEGLVETEEASPLPSFEDDVPGFDPSKDYGDTWFGGEEQGARGTAMGPQDMADDVDSDYILADLEENYMDRGVVPTEPAVTVAVEKYVYGEYPEESGWGWGDPEELVDKLENLVWNKIETKHGISRHDPQPTPDMQQKLEDNLFDKINEYGMDFEEAKRIVDRAVEEQGADRSTALILLAQKLESSSEGEEWAARNEENEEYQRFRERAQQLDEQDPQLVESERITEFLYPMGGLTEQSHTRALVDQLANLDPGIQDVFEESDRVTEEVIEEMGDPGGDLQAENRATAVIYYLLENPDSDAWLAIQGQEGTLTSKSDDKPVKGALDVGGIQIYVEHPEGSTRSGVDRHGREWSSEMLCDYGRIPDTTGEDDEMLDAYVGPARESETVVVIDQFVDGEFDEQKLVLGFDDVEDALEMFEQQVEGSGVEIGDWFEESIDWLKEQIGADSGDDMVWKDGGWEPYRKRDGSVGWRRRTDLGIYDYRDDPPPGMDTSPPPWRLPEGGPETEDTEEDYGHVRSKDPLSGEAMDPEFWERFTNRKETSNLIYEAINNVGGPSEIDNKLYRMAQHVAQIDKESAEELDYLDDKLEDVGPEESGNLWNERSLGMGSHSSAIIQRHLERNPDSPIWEELRNMAGLGGLEKGLTEDEADLLLKEWVEAPMEKPSRRGNRKWVNQETGRVEYAKEKPKERGKNEDDVGGKTKLKISKGAKKILAANGAEESFNRYVQDITDRLSDDFNVKVKVEKVDKNEIYSHIDVGKKHGAGVYYKFKEDVTEIDYGTFSVPLNKQGSGLARDMFGTSLRSAKDMATSRGVPTKMSIEADISIGGYAWARTGFRLDEESEDSRFMFSDRELVAKDLRKRVNKKIEADDSTKRLMLDALDRFEAGEIDMPELAEVGKAEGTTANTSVAHGLFFGKQKVEGVHIGKATLLNSVWIGRLDVEP